MCGWVGQSGGGGNVRGHQQEGCRFKELKESTWPERSGAGDRDREQQRRGALGMRKWLKRGTEERIMTQPMCYF